MHDTGTRTSVKSAVTRSPDGAAAAIDMEQARALVDRLEAVRGAIGTRIYGQDDVVSQLLVGLLSGGHVLIEGSPGLGKTLLVRTIAEACGLDFSRIQFTPDLMPTDITGTIVLTYDDAGQARTEFQKGPVFTQLLLADEINRATPKTQSALLEAMQARTVTTAGKVHTLPEPFFVLATQNPIEMEGTYILPEAQLDRFLLKVDVPFPDEDVLDTILEETTGGSLAPIPAALSPQDILAVQALVRSVPVASHVRRAVVRFVLSTQPDRAGASTEVRDLIRFGVTPRGGQALILAAKAHAVLSGRFNVSFDDLEAVLEPVLRHRFQLNYEGQARGASAARIAAALFATAVKQAA